MSTKPETTAPRAALCNSVNVRTTSKDVSPLTYWRCAAGGQILNAGRLLPGWRRP